MAEAAVFGFHPCPDLSARRQIDRSPRPVPVMGRSVPLMKAAGAVWAHRTLAIGVDHGVSGDRQGRLLCTKGSLPLLAALADAAAATCRGAEPVPDKTGADAAPFRHARWALPLPGRWRKKCQPDGLSDRRPGTVPVRSDRGHRPGNAPRLPPVRRWGQCPRRTRAFGALVRTVLCVLWPLAGRGNAMRCMIRPIRPSRFTGSSGPYPWASSRNLVSARPYTTRSTISCLISAIALAGFRPLGQVLAQFMMVWQRYSLNGSSRLSSRSPVASSRLSMIQR